MPRVGASAIVATVADPMAFCSGRDFAAWIGLVPRQDSTGGKQKLGPISKQGDRYVRRILVVGAHAVLRYGRQNLKNIPGSRNCWRDDPKAEWVKSNQKRPMSEECQRAKIRPLISFHGLRHTWASMAGVPLMVVARNSGMPIPGWWRSTTVIWRRVTSLTRSAQVRRASG